MSLPWPSYFYSISAKASRYSNFCTSLVHLASNEKGSCENCVTALLRWRLYRQFPAVCPRTSLFSDANSREFVSLLGRTAQRDTDNSVKSYTTVLLEPESLLTCSKLHTHAYISHTLILFNRNLLQYYTLILYSGIQNSISSFRSSNMRRSVPKVPNPHFCKNDALCAKLFTSYSNTAIARNYEMWDRHSWHWAPHMCPYQFQSLHDRAP
jgi:hypothetical protein